MVSAHEESSDNYTMPKDVLSNGGDRCQWEWESWYGTWGDFD